MNLPSKLSTLALLLSAQPLFALEKPNIIIIYADDISALELPIYGSNFWSPPEGGNTSDPKYRAVTPVLDRLANEGCMVKTAWADVVCSPKLIGHIAQEGEYANYWAGKTQMKGSDLREFGFDEGAFTPGEEMPTEVQRADTAKNKPQS